MQCSDYMSSKQLVGETEIDYYHLSAQNNKKCEYCLFKHIVRMRFNFNKSMVALKGKLELKAHKMPFSMFSE